MRHGLALWQPFNVLKEFNDKFSKVFDPEFDVYNGSWNPKIDVLESEKDYKIHAEIPGVSKDNIHIDVKENTLIVNGEKNFEKKEEKDNYLRVERAYGKFQRSFYLDEHIDRENIKANYKDGVLELTLPKKEETTPKNIEVKVN